MLLLTTQDKSTMIILDRLSAVVDLELAKDYNTNRSTVTRYTLGLKVLTAKHEFIVCKKTIDKDSPEINMFKDQLKQLKADIVEAYRTYRDNLTINNFNDEYYYIDYNFKLQKVNTTKETL